MKILKIMGIAIALLITTFLILGMVFKTLEYGSTIAVQIPQHQCWNAFHDTSTMKAWNASFKSLKLKQGQYLQVGSTYELVMEDNGEKMIMSETITNINAPRQISYLLTNDVLQSEFIYTFVPMGDSTKIESRYKVSGNNLIWRSILFISKGYLADASQAQLRAFKKHIEK